MDEPPDPVVVDPRPDEQRIERSDEDECLPDAAAVGQRGPWRCDPGGWPTTTSSRSITSSARGGRGRPSPADGRTRRCRSSAAGSSFRSRAGSRRSARQAQPSSSRSTRSNGTRARSCACTTTLRIAKLAVRDDPASGCASGSGFYDGAYFYAIARDPLATGQAHQLLDRGAVLLGSPGVRVARLARERRRRPRLASRSAARRRPARDRGRRRPCEPPRAQARLDAVGRPRVALNPGLVFAVATTRASRWALPVLLAASPRTCAAGVAGRSGCSAALCFVEGAARPRAACDRRLGALAAPASAARRVRRRAGCALVALPARSTSVRSRSAGNARLATPLRRLEAGLSTRRAIVGSGRRHRAARPGGRAVDRRRRPRDPRRSNLRAAAAHRRRARRFSPSAALYACITPNGVQYPKDLIRSSRSCSRCFRSSSRAERLGEPSARRYPRAHLPSRATTRKLKAKSRGQIRASMPGHRVGGAQRPLSPDHVADRRAEALHLLDHEAAVRRAAS